MYDFTHCLFRRLPLHTDYSNFVKLDDSGAGDGGDDSGDSDVDESVNVCIA